MTARTTSAIGKRMIAIRKLRHISTSAELSARISNPKITQSVIQNIESGRKADITVSQLLDIAMGLGVSPLFLLLDVHSPGGRVDLENVGPDVAAMTMDQLDQWLAMPQVTAGGVQPTIEALTTSGSIPADQNLRGPLSAVRELRSSRTVRDKLLEALGRIQAESDSPDRTLRLQGTIERLSKVDVEIHQWSGLAERWGVDLTALND